jgi:glutaredoxin
MHTRKGNLIAPLQLILIQEGRLACRKLLQMEIYLYTEPGCGACIEAKSFLTSHGISFEERDVRANPEYLRILTDVLDSCTLPTLVAGDTIIPGFEREAYENLPELFRLKQIR